MAGERIKLVLKDAQIVKLAQHPGENGDTQVLGMKALLTRPLAQQLGCHDNCFAENGMPRRYVDLPLTGLVIEQCEVELDGQTVLANTAQNFKCGRPKTKSETDASLEVTFNLHFAYSPWLSDWAHRKNKAQFSGTMNPPPDWNAQQSLFDKADPDQGGDDDDDDCDEGPHCIECANEIPMAPGSTTVHDSGQPCRKPKTPTVEVVAAAPPELETPGAPVLASAREAAGGTHAKRRGRPPGSSRGGVVEMSVGVEDPPQPASNASRPVVN